MSADLSARGISCSGEEAENRGKPLARRKVFPLAEMWVKPWNNKAYTYTYATTRTLLSSDEARGEILQYAKKVPGKSVRLGRDESYKRLRLFRLCPADFC